MSQSDAYGKVDIVKSINKNIPLFWCDSKRHPDVFDRGNFPTVSVGDTVIAIDPNYYRPTEVDLLIGDSKKAKNKLGWQAKTKMEKLVEIMVKSDLQKVLVKGY